MLYNRQTMYLLLIAFVVFLAFIISFGASQIMHYDEKTSFSDKIYKHPFTVANAAKTINTDILKMHREMKDLALANNTSEREASYKIVNKLEQQVFQQFKIIHQRFLGNLNRPKQAEEQFRQWRPIREEIYTLSNEGKFKEAIFITRNKGAQYVKSLIKSLDAFVIFANNKALEFLEESRIQAQKAKEKLTYILSVLLIIGFILFILLARYIQQLFLLIAQNNKDLKRTIQSLHKAQSLAKLGSWKLDHLTGELTWSEETFAIFELQPSEKPLTYEDFLSFIHPDDVENVNIAYMNSLKNHTNYEIEHRICLHDNKIKHVKEQVENTYSPQGQILMSYGTVQDITKDINTRNTQIEKSRLKQMSHMLAMIAHQWRQPLTSISVVISNIKIRKSLGTINDKEMDEKLDDALLYISELSQTIVDFQHYFNPNTKPTPFSLNQLVQKSLDMSAHLFEEEGIKIHKELEPLEPIINLENEILQVFLSMYHNTIDAIKEVNPDKPEISIRLYRQVDRQILTICDNAQGIPEDVIDHVFDPYVSTKSKNGRGLGLFISKIVIEEHCNATLSVVNENNGACFIFSFPTQ